MQHTSTDIDTLLAELVQGLSSDWEQLARDTGAFARARKVKTVLQLFRLVMLYCALDKSLRDCAGHHSMLVEPISDSSVMERLEGCQLWLAEMLEDLMPEPCPKAPKGRRMVVVDGSTSQAPGAKGTDHRLMIMIDLSNLTLLFADATDYWIGESLLNYPLQRGDLVMGDRGYCRPKPMQAVLDKGVDLAIRFAPHNCTLEMKDGTRLDADGLAQKLKAWSKETSSISQPVHLVVDGQVQPQVLYLHGYKLPPEQAAQARRRARANCKKGTEPTATTLELRGWVLVLTSLSLEEASGELVLSWYRRRWQVELVIKRLKSLLSFDQLRARRDSPLAWVWLLGKLLYAVLLQRRLGQWAPDLFKVCAGPRQETLWRPMKMMHDWFTGRILLTELWTPEQFEKSLAALRERRRRRKLQLLAHDILSQVEAQAA